jgi:flagellar basal-body rod protein FlgB
MDLSTIPFFDLINKRLAWLSQRQDILAENVSNGDTPGYKPRDLKEQTFADMLHGANSGGIQLAATQPGHFGASMRPNAYKVIDDPKATPTINGNAVDMEGEMMKVSKTGIDYQFAINLYKKQIGMIKTALGRSGG